MNGTTGTQVGPSWDCPILTLLATIPGLTGTCQLRASCFHPTLGTPGTLPSSLLPAGREVAAVAGDKVALTRCHSGTRRAPGLKNEWIHPQRW